MGVWGGGGEGVRQYTCIDSSSSCSEVKAKMTFALSTGS